MAIGLDIPESMIRDAIAVAIAESFTAQRRDALLRDIVRAHLQYKEREYDKETLLNKRLGELIRKISLEEMDKVVLSMSSDIRRIIQEALGPQFEESVYESLRQALRMVSVRNFTISANIDDPQA